MLSEAMLAQFTDNPSLIPSSMSPDTYLEVLVRCTHAYTHTHMHTHTHTHTHTYTHTHTHTCSTLHHNVCVSFLESSSCGVPVLCVSCGSGGGGLHGPPGSHLQVCASFSRIHYTHACTCMHTHTCIHSMTYMYT